MSEEGWMAKVREERRSAVKGYPWLENTTAYRYMTTEKLDSIYRRAQREAEGKRRDQEKADAKRNAEIAQENKEIARKYSDGEMGREEVKARLAQDFIGFGQFGPGNQIDIEKISTEPDKDGTYRIETPFGGRVPYDIEKLKRALAILALYDDMKAKGGKK